MRKRRQGGRPGPGIGPFPLPAARPGFRAKSPKRGAFFAVLRAFTGGLGALTVAFRPFFAERRGVSAEPRRLSAEHGTLTVVLRPSGAERGA